MFFFLTIPIISIRLDQTRAGKRSDTMGDALDSWVDLAKECSPVRSDICVAFIKFCHQYVIQSFGPNFWGKFLSGYHCHHHQVTPTLWWVARLPGNVARGAGWDKLQVIFHQQRHLNSPANSLWFTCKFALIYLEIHMKSLANSL